MRNSGTRLKTAMTEVAATVCGVTKGNVDRGRPGGGVMSRESSRNQKAEVEGMEES